MKNIYLPSKSEYFYLRGFGGRLTWDKNGPAPYESARTVFKKIMQINEISFVELFDIIRKDSVQGLPENFLTNGHWIDFYKYSRILRIDECLLRQGFLDQSGFDVSRNPSFGVRHCPECMKFKYHCVFFDLPFLCKCPWHDCFLSKACNSCIFKETAEWQFRLKKMEYKGCKCYGISGEPESRIKINTVPLEIRKAILQHADELIEWWVVIKQRAPESYFMLTDIFSAYNAWTPRGLTKDKLEIGSIDEIVNFPKAWAHSIEPIPAYITCWNEHPGASLDDGNAGLEEWKRRYRYIRRYIFDRFIRQHRSCLNQLLKMFSVERLSLERKRYCSLCTAYLSWLDFYENRLEKSFRDSAGFPRGRLIVSNFPTPGSIEMQIFLDFVTIWASLEYLAEQRDVCVQVGCRAERTVDLPFGLGYRVDPTTGPHLVSLVIAPDYATLVERSRKRCSLRKSQGSQMYDERASQKKSDFSWKRSDHENKIFRIVGYTRDDRLRPATYEYLTC